MKKKISLTILGILLVYGSVAFAMKAGIGVLPVDAAIATIADVLHIKVGTFSMLFHGSFFIGQLVLDHKNMKKTELLQILYVTLGGSVLNFIYYTVLANVTFTLYPVRLIVSVLSFLTGAFGCTLVLETHLMRTPMEGFIQLVADKTGTTMGKLRQKIDLVLVLLCVILTLGFLTDWSTLSMVSISAVFAVVLKARWQLREGTVIAALIFGPAMDFWKKHIFAKNS